MGAYKKLDVWRRTQQLASSIYRLTGGFPNVERFGLSAQMRRAAVLVTANLAEGCGRQGDRELRRFVRISLGSLSELEGELLLAADLQLIESDVRRALCLEIRAVRRMLQRLHKALPSSRSEGLSP